MCPSSVVIGTLRVFSTNPRSQTLGKYFLYSRKTLFVNRNSYSLLWTAVRGSSLTRSFVFPLRLAVYCYYLLLLLLLLFSFIIITFDFHFTILVITSNTNTCIAISQLSLSPPFIETVSCFILLRFFYSLCSLLLVFNPFAVCYNTAATQICLLRGLSHI